MEHHEHSLTAVDGTHLFCQSWRPEAPPRAVVIVCHGVADHGGRYPHLVASLAAHGYAVCAHDYRGHGRSGGRRLHVDAFGDYVRDLEIHRGDVAKTYPSLPVFLFGHSMGSIVALEFALDRPDAVQGLICSGTALLAGEGFAPWLLTLNRLLGRVVPRLRLVSLPTEGVSRDSDWVQQTRADPLIYHGPGTVRLGNEILTAQARVRARLAEVDLPLLVIHGDADPLVDPAGARMLFEGASSPDKTLRLYEGARHEVYNDLPPTREAMLGDLVAWLDARSLPTHNPEGVEKGTKPSFRAQRGTLFMRVKAPRLRSGRQCRSV